MSRKRSTILNVLVSCTKLVFCTLLALFVSQKILIFYGSSVNGVVATATQVIAWLQILEGGFSTATIVALYHPYANKEYDELNALISTTAAVFRKIAVYAFVVGMAISVIYPIFLKTELSYTKRVVIFGLVVLTTSANFAFFQASKILFVVAQKEYIMQTVNIICTIATQLLILLLILFKLDILWLRVVTALLLLIDGAWICLMAKKYFPFLNLRTPHEGRKIKGTKDVLVSNIVIVMSKTLPMMMIATIFGASMASVYSVYFYVFSVVAHALYSITIAPQNAFGQLFYSKTNDMERFKDMFQTYETAILLVAVGAYSTCALSVLPFVSLYTAKLPDQASYLNPLYVVFFCLANLVQIIHVPAGLLLQISGQFKTIKRIQIVMVLAMLILGCSGAFLKDIAGLLTGLLIAHLIYAVCDIFFTYRRILSQSLLLFARKLLLISAAGVLFGYVEYLLLPPLETWLSVILASGAIGLSNLILIAPLALLIIPKTMRKELFQYLRKLKDGIFRKKTLA